MDQCAQVSCRSGSWMNGSFDSRKRPERLAVGRECLAGLGIDSPPPVGKNACKSEGRNTSVTNFTWELLTFGGLK